MANVKATHGQITREITIAPNTTWTEFESRLHDLFNIPNETEISVSYIDEDDDVINLSTDSELQQVLSDQELFGASVRFNVYTSENPDSDGWNLENAEENDEPVVTLKDEEIVAYKIGEPNETENTKVEQIESSLQHEGQDNVQQEKEQQEQEQESSVVSYPHVTVTDENDDPSFEPTVPKEKDSEKQQELLSPVNPTNEEIDQKQEFPIESSNDTEKQSTTSPGENVEENNQESENDSNIFFIISSSPWIRRTYYRPRVSLLLGEYPTHFGHFARPRHSFVTPIYNFGGHRSRSCGRYYGGRGIGGRSYNNFWGYC